MANVELEFTRSVITVMTLTADVTEKEVVDYCGLEEGDVEYWQDYIEEYVEGNLETLLKEGNVYEGDVVTQYDDIAIVE